MVCGDVGEYVAGLWINAGKNFNPLSFFWLERVAGMRMSWIKRVKLIGGIIGVRQYRRIGMESGSESVIGGLLKQCEFFVMLLM